MATARSSTRQHKEATAILRADHKLVSDLFAQFEKAEGSEKKRRLVEQICMELTVHAQIEEEIFYPAVKEVLHGGKKEEELVPEATVEHQSLKQLIEDIEGTDIEDELYDARVKVLGEYVKHHVKEEQNEIFPKVRESELDMVELGAQLMQRKQELQKALR
jgi:hemerythrin superfamily protein